MRQAGLTLLELLTTLAISTTLLLLTIPVFNEQIQHTRTRAASQELLDAIELSRTMAVSSNSRAVLMANNKKWHTGWKLFIDTNNDGLLSKGEITVKTGTAKSSVITQSSSPMDSYVSFIGTGESKQINRAILAGNIKICPKKKGAGYSLILSRGGRTRIEKLAPGDCALLQR
jgi:type IV fimbrial biogenesis protein FimT